MIVSGLGACALAISCAACVADASSESDEAPAIEEPSKEPEMAADCNFNTTHTCCLNGCGDSRYECNQGCDDVPQPNRANCLNSCEANHLA